jgi:hypothetical protein
MSSNTVAGAATAWWAWIAPRSMQAQFDTLGSELDTRLAAFAIFTNASTTNYEAIAFNDDDPSSGGLTSLIRFPAAAGATYWIRLDGFDGAFGAFNLSWQCAPAGLEIARNGAIVLLNWPSGYALQAAPTPEFGAQWIDVAVEPPHTESAVDARYYRLICR